MNQELNSTNNNQNSRCRFFNGASSGINTISNQSNSNRDMTVGSSEKQRATDINNSFIPTTARGIYEREVSLLNKKGINLPEKAVPLLEAVVAFAEGMGNPEEIKKFAEEYFVAKRAIEYEYSQEIRDDLNKTTGVYFKSLRNTPYRENSLMDDSTKAVLNILSNLLQSGTDEALKTKIKTIIALTIVASLENIKTFLGSFSVSIDPSSREFFNLLSDADKEKCQFFLDQNAWYERITKTQKSKEAPTTASDANLKGMIIVLLVILLFVLKFDISIRHLI